MKTIFNSAGILTLCLTLQSLICCGQNLNLDSLFNNYRNLIQLQRRGYGDPLINDDETRISYYLVAMNSSIDDLVAYTNDSDPYIRAQMFIALVRKKPNAQVLEKILEDHKNDTVSFPAGGADVFFTWKVKEYMETVMRLGSTMPEIDYEKAITYVRARAKKEIEIEGMNRYTVAKDSLLQMDSLKLTVSGYTIRSFDLYVDTLEFRSSNNVLTAEMKMAITRSPP